MNTPDTSSRTHAEQALEIFDRVLAERPDELHQPLTDAVRAVVRLRDTLIERRLDQNAPRASEHLDRVNQIASLAYSSQFPIVGVKWDRIESTRNALRDLVEQL